MSAAENEIVRKSMKNHEKVDSLDINASGKIERANIQFIKKCTFLMQIEMMSCL